MAETGIGSDVKRREDFRFLKGVGRYTDDVTLPKQTYMYLLRSGVAHANIKNIDTSKAKGAPGVLAVYTHDDLAADGVGGVPCGWEITSRDGNKMAEPAHPVLASGKVRHVGDPIVAVIAESLNQAKNAAELVDVHLDELTPVVDTGGSLKKGGEPVHEEAPANLCFDWELGDKAATAE